MHRLIMSRSRAVFFVWVWNFGYDSGWVFEGVAHVAGNPDRAAEGLGVGEVLVALVHNRASPWPFRQIRPPPGRFWR